MTVKNKSRAWKTRLASTLSSPSLFFYYQTSRQHVRYGDEFSSSLGFHTSNCVAHSRSPSRKQSARLSNTFCFSTSADRNIPT